MRRMFIFIIAFFIVALSSQAIPTVEAHTKHDPTPVATTITSLDPRFDQLVPHGAKLERIAEGFAWVEGPVWHKEGGYLLFSDIPTNSVYKWKPGEHVSLFMKNSGYSGRAPFVGREPGSNGLIFDPQGRLVLCRHGDRQIGRLEASGTIVPLADRYDGYQINS